MTRSEYWEMIDKHEAEMNDEIIRVMEIMDDHGYEFCDHVDFDYSHQFVSVDATFGGRIISYTWAIPNREQFKDVLKWFCGKTKFYGVTGHMAYDGEWNVAKGHYRPIPTFYTVNDVDREYDHYFGY